LIRAVGPGVSSWPLREARPGERVAICYRGPAGNVQYTSPLSVLTASADSLTLSMSHELVRGMSGGAVVALDDLAMLGVYEGVGRQQALALAFTPAMFASVHSVSDVVSVSNRGSFDVIEKMKDKGLGKYVEGVFDSLVPLFFRDAHVGHAVGGLGGCVTSMDPNAVPLSVAPGATPFVYTEMRPFLYGSMELKLPTPLLRRAPSYYERVVVVGKDSDGPYYSEVTRVMHIGAGGANFSLETLDKDVELPYEGGLVMALSDAAVLGICVRQTSSPRLGVVEFCVPYPADSQSVTLDFRPVSDYLAKKYPMLHPSSWPVGVLEEVVTHSSCQTYVESGRPFNAGMAPLAFLGDMVLKLRYGEKARDAAVPMSLWASVIQSTQSDSALAAYAKLGGFDAFVRFGGATGPLPEGSRVYAEAVAALVGAVYLYEAQETTEMFVDSLLSALGVVYGSGPLTPC